MKQFIASFLLSILFCTLATKASASWTLAWDANDPSDNVITYHLYEHVNGEYNFVGSTPPPTGPTLTYAIDVLTRGTHYFVVTAVNAHGESGYSNEISIKVNNSKPPAQKPSGEVEIDLTDAGSSGEAAVSD